tara:strand:+ start:4117 stop:4347 length:231 start_codon:yes stop_codon:yes gene_type:complete
MEKNRKQEILDEVLSSVDLKNQNIAVLKKLFKPKELDEILEYIFEILWKEKFNPDDKKIVKEIKEYINLQIKARSS